MMNVKLNEMMRLSADDCTMKLFKSVPDEISRFYTILIIVFIVGFAACVFSVFMSYRNLKKKLKDADEEIKRRSRDMGIIKFDDDEEDDDNEK